jgi:hypothetical protein
MPTDLNRAQDPRSDPSVLAPLANHPDEDVRGAVARNPNTPFEQLIGLIEDHTTDVLENPALPLLLLEVPDLWEQLSWSVRMRIARSSACPEAFLHWRLGEAQDWSGDLPLMMHGRLPLSLRRKLFLHRQTRDGLLQNEELVAALGEDFLELLQRAGYRPGPRRGQLDPTLSESDLAALAGYGGIGFGLAVQHPSCPAAVVVQALHSSDDVLRLYAARHPALPPAELARMARETPFPVAATGRAITTAELRTLLQRESHRGLQLAFAAHPSLPASLAVSWAREALHPVRVELARNPGTPDEALALLARDEQREVRLAVARRPELPRALRQLLQEDADAGVRSQAASPHLQP